MISPKSILLPAFLFLGGVDFGFAHMDPAGDVHPSVVVEEGHFSIYFYNNAAPRGLRQEPPSFRMRYSASGKLVAPRHRVEERKSEETGVWLAQFHSERPVAHLGEEDAPKSIVPLRWPDDDLVRMVETSCLSPDHIAAAVKLKNEKDPFYLYLFPRIGYRMPERFLIGEPAKIYDFPTASNVIFAENRFWIAWVRLGEMILSSVAPGDKEPKKQVIDLPGNWNSTISMAAIGSRLCVVCHSSENFAYPGQSTIHTLFLDLKTVGRE